MPPLPCQGCANAHGRGRQSEWQERSLLSDRIGRPRRRQVALRSLYLDVDTGVSRESAKGIDGHRSTVGRRDRVALGPQIPVVVLDPRDVALQRGV